MCNKSRVIKVTNESGSVPNPPPEPTPEVETDFGALINGDFSVAEKRDVALDLHCSHTRLAIQTTTWDGTSNAFETYDAAGLKVLMNINRGNSPYPFVPLGNTAQMDAYMDIVRDILDTYVPEMVVVENEEFNRSYHTGTLEEYCAMLHEVALECQSRSIKVTNGGMAGPGIRILTYRDLVTIGRQADADYFAANCMTNKMLKSAKFQITDYDAHIDDTSLVLAQVAADCDYCNIHYYEDINPYHTASQVASLSAHTPYIVEYMTAYILKVTGKKTVTNETGQDNNVIPSLVTSMMAEYRRLGFDYVTWFSGDGDGGAKALNNPDGSLRSNGIAFRDYIDSL